MNKNTELKRCPFCGGEAFPYKHKGFIEIVRCKGCGVEATGYDRQKVIDKWNNRPLEDEAYEAGLQHGVAQALSRNAGLSDWQRVDCVGKHIQANQTGTGGPKIC